MALTLRELTSSDWPVVERLFGPSGACVGCWCMFWRLEAGERFADVKGPRAKRRLRALIEAGRVMAVLALDGDEPVGWLTFGPRLEFPKLDRSKNLACDDPDRVWSLPCFFVKPGHRGEGVSTAMLAYALKAMRKRGARVAEGYPVRLEGGERVANADAYTGTPAMFEAAGFEVVGGGGRRSRVRRALRAGGERGRQGARGAKESAATPTDGSRARPRLR